MRLMFKWLFHREEASYFNHPHYHYNIASNSHNYEYLFGSLGVSHSNRKMRSK